MSGIEDGRMDGYFMRSNGITTSPSSVPQQVKEVKNVPLASTQQVKEVKNVPLASILFRLVEISGFGQQAGKT